MPWDVIPAALRAATHVTALSTSHDVYDRRQLKYCNAGFEKWLRPQPMQRHRCSGKNDLKAMFHIE